MLAKLDEQAFWILCSATVTHAVQTTTLNCLNQYFCSSSVLSTCIIIY